MTPLTAEEVLVGNWSFVQDSYIGYNWGGPFVWCKNPDGKLVLRKAMVKNLDE